MPNYLDGKRPEPGRLHGSQNINAEIDIEKLAEAIAKKLPGIKNESNKSNKENNIKEENDGFDNKNTLERLADSMVVQRDKNESNFKDLGKTKETKKDKDEVDKTIDLLKDLD